MAAKVASNPYPLVLIEWADSLGCSRSWEPLSNCDEEPPLVVCKSVGWLLHDGLTTKVIVPHIGNVTGDVDDQQGCGEMTIPTRAVLRITSLVEGRTRGKRPR